MTAHIALLKAVNVGGTGKMPMADLKHLCEEAGLENVKTYIASGNVVFSSKLSQAKVKALLEEKIEAYFGKPVPVMVRSPAQMQAVLENNPFKEHPPNRTIVSFLDKPPSKNLMDGARHQKDEEVATGKKEIYLYYPDGQGRTKFVLPAAKNGTGRNINTVTILIELAKAL